MTRMLVVLNGANYSREAVRKALWVAKSYGNQNIDLLYINPTWREICPELPGYSFWLSGGDYEGIIENFKNRVFEEIKPLFDEMKITPGVIVRNGSVDREIYELGRHCNYDHIFVTSPSRYCDNGRVRVKRKLERMAECLVCLV